MRSGGRRRMWTAYSTVVAGPAEGVAAVRAANRNDAEVRI